MYNTTKKNNTRSVKKTPIKTMCFLLTVKNAKLAVISGKDLDVLVMLKNAHSSKLNYDVYITAEFPDQVQLMFATLKYFVTRHVFNRFQDCSPHHQS